MLGVNAVFGFALCTDLRTAVIKRAADYLQCFFPAGEAAKVAVVDVLVGIQLAAVVAVLQYIVRCVVVHTVERNALLKQPIDSRNQSRSFATGVHYQIVSVLVQLLHCFAHIRHTAQYHRIVRPRQHTVKVNRYNHAGSMVMVTPVVFFIFPLPSHTEQTGCACPL